MRQSLNYPGCIIFGTSVGVLLIFFLRKAFMGRRLLPSLHMVLVLLGCAASQAMFSQQTAPSLPRHDYEIAGSPLSASPVDKQIAAALGEVSPEKIKTNIETLVGFKNRNTTSSTESDLAPGKPG